MDDPANLDKDHWEQELRHRLSECEAAAYAHGRLTRTQQEQLLRPLARHRVVDDGRGHAALSGQDVRAHLTRIFGFCGWRAETVTLEPVIDRQLGASGVWLVAYRATVRLSVYGASDLLAGQWTGSNIGSHIGWRQERAHQIALTSAETLALKRAAIPLGDQFGLSLYGGGSFGALVGGTLATVEDPTADIQDLAPRQVVDEMTGADPADPHEMERIGAYLSSDPGDRGGVDQADTDTVAVDDQDSQAQQVAWLLEEIAFMSALVPGLDTKMAARLEVEARARRAASGDGSATEQQTASDPAEQREPDPAAGLESATLDELAALVAPMRMITVVQLRLRGAHTEADRYSRAATDRRGRPARELLGCEYHEVLERSVP